MQRDFSSRQWRWFKKGGLDSKWYRLGLRRPAQKGWVEWEPPSATSLVTGYNNMWVWMIWVCSIHTHIYIYIRKDGKRIVFRWLTNCRNWKTWGPPALRWSIGLHALGRLTSCFDMRAAETKLRALKWHKEGGQTKTHWDFRESTTRPL